MFLSSHSTFFPGQLLMYIHLRCLDWLIDAQSMIAIELWRKVFRHRASKVVVRPTRSRNPMEDYTREMSRKCLQNLSRLN